MVNFTDRSSVYYYRNPYNTVRQTNGFYNDNFGMPVNPGNVYNPTSYNYYNPPAGVTSPVNTALGAIGLAAQFVPGAAGNLPPYSMGEGGRGVLRSYENSNYLYPDQQRLNGSDLPPGAEYTAMIEAAGGEAVNTTFVEYGMGDQKDTRVIITDPTAKFVSGTITQPLSSMRGVLFPYTPNIRFNHRANYDMQQLTHSNYEQPFFVNSAVETIGIDGVFTASNIEEAKYVLAVIHFFRSVTKMFYGQDSLAGTPPPILFLDGHGKIMLNHIPIVILDFSMTLPDNVDYIRTTQETNSSENNNVPTELKITLNCKPIYSRNRISNVFGLEKFVKGDLLVGGTPGSPGPGGFI